MIYARELPRGGNTFKLSLALGLLSTWDKPLGQTCSMLSPVIVEAGGDSERGTSDDAPPTSRMASPQPNRGDKSTKRAWGTRLDG